jgi:vitamin B12 transporter
MEGGKKSLIGMHVALPSAALLVALSFANPILEGQVQPDTTVLEPVVVTATRLALPLSSIPATVSVLDGAELDARGVRTVAQALRTIPGLSVVETGSYGSATSVFVRGGESDHVKVLVDGVPLNSPGGSIDFANLTIDNVERIEVVRGATSVLYGSDAVAGVVQIFTRRGKGSPKLAVGLRGGTYASLMLDASLSGATRAMQYGFGFSRSTTNGVHEFNSEYENLVLSGSVSAQPDRSTDAVLSARFSDSEFHFPTDESGNVVDRNSFQLQQRVVASLDIGRSFGDWLEGRVLLALNHVDAGMDDEQDDASDTLGFFAFGSEAAVERKSVDVRSNVHLLNMILTAGVQIENQSERSTSESVGQYGVFADSINVGRSSWGYYAQVQTEAIEGVTVNAGMRLDDSDTFGAFVTYRVGVAAAFASGSRLRGSVGKAFKEPTIYENFATSPFAVGNPDLEPERSRSWELGIEQVLIPGRVRLAATYFNQRFEDLIQYNVLPANAGEPNYVNVAAAKASGLELEARTFLLPRVTLGGRYSLVRTEVTDAGLDTGPDAGFVQGERLLRRPTHQLGLDALLGYEERGSLALHIDYVGSRDDRDFSGIPARRIELSDYLKIDAAGEFTVTRSSGARPSVTLSARLENVLNIAYQEAVGFPTRGRTVTVGVRFGT